MEIINMHRRGVVYNRETCQICDALERLFTDELSKQQAERAAKFGLMLGALQGVRFSLDSEGRKNIESIIKEVESN